MGRDYLAIKVNVNQPEFLFLYQYKNTFYSREQDAFQHRYHSATGEGEITKHFCARIDGKLYTLGIPKEITQRVY